MAAGDFIDVYAEQIAAQQIWIDPRNNRELQKPIVSAQSLLNEQGVRFVPQILKDGRCVGVEAIFLKSCDDTVTDCEQSANNIADCNVSGIEAEAAKKTYTPNVCLSKSIKVSADDCAGFNSFEEKIAFMKLKAMNALEVELNNKVVATIASNAQANTAPLNGTVNATMVEYSSAAFEGHEGAKLLSEFNISAQRQQIYDAFILNGINFYEAQWLYDYKEKAGSQSVFDSIFNNGPWQMYWDITALDTEVGGTQISNSFLIDKNAIGFFGQNEYMNDMSAKKELKSDMYVYRMPSRRLQYRNGVTMENVYFDVTEQWDCTISGAATVKNRRYQVVQFEFVLRGGLITGPADCNGGTGILHYTQV